MFDKSKDLFPIKDGYVFLAHCGVSPLYREALEKEWEISEKHHKKGGLIFNEYNDILNGLRKSAADLLKTHPDNLAFVKNTSEAMCLIANGYRFQEGDRVISYVYEYPANYYPWKLQERRGVELVLLPDRDIISLNSEDTKYCPCGWRMEDLEALVTDRTKILAISHVQFTSGFTADLKKLGKFCRAQGIDLVEVLREAGGETPRPTHQFAKDL